MKIRTGFVSNSSSSSFIVACKKESKTKVTISFEVNLESYIDRSISTIEELNEYYDDEYIDREWKYEECRKSIEAGKTILIGRFDSQSGDQGEEFLCDSGLKGYVDENKVEIIQSEGGF